MVSKVVGFVGLPMEIQMDLNESQIFLPFFFFFFESNKWLSSDFEGSPAEFGFGLVTADERPPFYSYAEPLVLSLGVET